MRVSIALLFALVAVSQAQYFDPRAFSTYEFVSTDYYEKPQGAGVLTAIAADPYTLFSHNIIYHALTSIHDNYYWTSYQSSVIPEVPEYLNTFSVFSGYADTLGSKWYVPDSSANIVAPAVCVIALIALVV